MTNAQRTPPDGKGDEELISAADRELALLWAESSGQRREVCELADLPEALRANYSRMADRDMAKARAYLKLPAAQPVTPLGEQRKEIEIAWRRNGF